MIQMEIEAKQKADEEKRKRQQKLRDLREQMKREKVQADIKKCEKYVFILVFIDIHPYFV